MTAAPPPPAGSEDLADDLKALSPEATWRREGDALTCRLSDGTVTVRPGPNGGWEVERRQDDQAVDRRIVHGGLDGTAAEQVADIVLGWGG